MGDVVGALPDGYTGGGGSAEPDRGIDMVGDVVYGSDGAGLADWVSVVYLVTASG